LCEGDALEGHPGWCCVHLYARILSSPLTSVSIFSVCCYSIVSISMVPHAMHSLSDDHVKSASSIYQQLDLAVVGSSEVSAQAACSCKLPSINKSWPPAPLLLLRFRSGSILWSIASVVNKVVHGIAEELESICWRTLNLRKNGLHMYKDYLMAYFLCILILFDFYLWEFKACYCVKYIVLWERYCGCDGKKTFFPNSAEKIS
jgi:hypothetical protein